MNASYAPRPHLDNWASRDAKADAEIKEEERSEAYDSFDILKGIPFSHHSKDLPRKPTSSVISGQRSRAQSFDSNYSSVTTDLFITSSQAASPGVSTSYVELTESQEGQLSKLLGTDPVPTRLSPTPGPPESNDTTFARPGSTDKQTFLPSFNALLQSVGQSRPSSASPLRQFSKEGDADYVPTTRDSSTDRGMATSPPRDTFQYSTLFQMQRTDPHLSNLYAGEGARTGGREEVVGPDLNFPARSQFRRAEPVFKTSTRRLSNVGARRILVEAVDLSPPKYTAAHTNDVPATTTLPTGNGARPGLMSITNLLDSPLQSRQYSTRPLEDLSPVQEGPQPKKRRTSHATEGETDYILPTSSSWITPRSFESEENLESVYRRRTPPQIPQSHADSASILSVPSFGTEPPPTTPDWLLVDLSEESDSSDELDLAGKEDGGK